MVACLSKYIFLLRLKRVINIGIEKEINIMYRYPCLVSILAHGANNNAGKKIIYEGNFKLRMLIKF
jgi:hypothetical protein